MKLRPPALLGIAFGLTAALLVIGNSFRSRSPATGPMLADFGGRIRSVVMQYTAGSKFLWPVYQQFLSQQSPDLTVYMLCPEQADFDELTTALPYGQPQVTTEYFPPFIKCKILPILTHHIMTPWSRDRWVALLPTAREKRITLLAPKGELSESWPEREGDTHNADDLAHALPDLLRVQKSELFFDGGDYQSDGPFLFATRALLERNLQHTVRSKDQLLTAIAAETHLTPILMEDAPDHHAGMYIMPAGNHRMLVVDPSLGEKVFDPNAPEAAQLDGGPDFSPEMQSHFDYVADLAQKQGYTVTRIPGVVPKIGKGYLTYVNGIIDATSGPTPHPIIYMTTFAGQQKMNQAATKVWQSLGYEVRPIDCSTTWTKGGTLHCLVNVLQRDPQ